MPLFTAALRIKQMLTPSVPPAGEGAIYFKTDGLPYCLDPAGVERPLIDVVSSLHLNPTFDSVVSGKPSNWDDFWLTSPAALLSDTSVAVSGASAKVYPCTGTTVSTGWLTEQVTHSVNDQQTINFGVYARTDLGGSPVLNAMHITAVASADAGILNPNAIFTGRTFSLDNTFRNYQMSFPVPAGHLFGRFGLSVSWTGSQTGKTVWFDESTSSAVNAPPGSTLPAGSIMMFGGISANVPSGWLLCNGQAISRSTYAALYAAVGTNFGIGDGSTTFNVPDMQSRMAVGAGSVGGPGATEGGAPENQRPSRFDHRHQHTVTALTNSSVTHGGVSTTTATGTTDRMTRIDGSLNGSHTHNIGGSVDQGALLSGIVNHPFTAVNYIIKT